MAEPPAQKLFSNVRYYISVSISTDRSTQLANVLDEEGAVAVPLADPTLTHAITVSPLSGDGLEGPPANEAAHVVTPLWVERACIQGSLSAPDAFSPDPAQIFSGVTAACTGLSQPDEELFSAAISALGGQWRTALTRDVTHLFALSPHGAKYETAMHFRDKTAMHVLVPHWFDDSVRLGIRDLPTQDYEWPAPRVFMTLAELAQQDHAALQRAYKMPKERRAFYDTALETSNDLPFRRAPSRDVWQGLRILLSPSLELSESQRDAHEEDIRREGGVVVQLASLAEGGKTLLAEELQKVSVADVLITRYKAGPAFAEAYKHNKMIGSLSWLWYVRSCGALSRPNEHLLHSPIPKKPIEGFANQLITITNYTGKDREYLKKLISTMGGEFTPSMSGRNTVVIAAYISGIKTTKALSWSIPIVNHTWLEDCFAQWRLLTPATEKYVFFPPGVDFARVLAGRPVPRVYVRGLDAAREQEARAAAAAAAADDDDREHLDVGETSDAGPAPSASSVREVEDVVNLRGSEEAGDISMGALMDVDADLGADVRAGAGARAAARPRPRPVLEKQDDRMDVDRERGREKAKVLERRKTRSMSRAERGERSPQRVKGSDAPAEEAAPSESPGKAPRKKPVRRYGRRSTKDKPALETDEDAASEAPAPAVSPARPTAQTGAKGKGKGKQKAVDGQQSGDEARRQEHPVPRTSRKRPPAALFDSDSDAISILKPAGKGKGKKKAATDDPPAASDSDVEMLPADVPKPQPYIRRPKPPMLSDTEDDVGEPGARRATAPRNPPAEPTTPSHRTSPAKSARTPGRQVSVVLPTLAAVYRSPPKHAASSASPGKPATLTESAHARPPGAAETARRAAAKRGPPPPSKAAAPPRAASPEEGASSPSPAPAPPAGRTRRDSGVATAAEPGPAAGPSAPALVRTPSRRSAASKATARLRNEVMPDVLNFQREMRRGDVRAAWEGKNDGGGAVQGPSSERGKGKKRASLATEEGEEEAEAEAPERKRQRTEQTKKGKQVMQKEKEKGGRRRSLKNSESAEHDQEDRESEDGGGKPQRKFESKAAGKSTGPPKSSGESRSSDTLVKNVRIMTTQVTVADEVTKTLTRMGCKFTTKPAECTHLVAKSLVRTEKFLCAMAVAPFVVNERWLTMSATTKRLLPPEDFALSDKPAEQKYNFTLAEALERGKEKGGGLFSGMTFYVTPKVKVDTKLLKNVVAAGGGTVVTQTPSVRILNANQNRYVISASEDMSIWRPLAEHGHPIYNTELILTGALKQEIDWEDAKNRVESS